MSRKIVAEQETPSTPPPQTRTLDQKHRAELHASGLTDATIEAAGIYSAADGEIATTLGWQPKHHPWLGGMVIPFRTSDGEEIEHRRVKLDHPRCDKDAKIIKYESPVKAPNRAYFPPGFKIGDTVILTEGEKKALAAWQAGFCAIGLVGVWGWQQKRKRDDKGHAYGSRKLIPDLAGIDWKSRRVVTAFDSDAAGKPEVQLAEDRLAEALTKAGATVKIVRIPPGPDGGKVGVDDYLVAHGAAELRRLIDGAEKAETPSPQVGDRDPATGKLILNPADPLPSARVFLSERFTIQDTIALRCYGGALFAWRDNHYVPVEDAALRASLYHFTESAVRVQRIGDTVSLVPFQPTSGKIGGLVDAVQAATHLSANVIPPAWLIDDPQLPAPGELLACRSGTLHIPTRRWIEPTPRLFITSALTFDFDADAPKPERWLSFLHDDLWPGDPQSVEALQDWFGYCLTGWTSLQKMLQLVGPKRSGKGTIARVQQALVGRGNVAGPTTSSLAGPFGLQPLIGKTLAVVSDARFAGDGVQTVVERLLCISGEDTLTIDCKNKTSITMKLPTRFMFLTNELPRVADTSGALAGRFIVLLLRRSFYDEEDTELTTKLLAELPGILLWALEGWERLRCRGRFIQPESSADAIRQLEELSSPVGAFLRERCLQGPNYQVNVDDLWEGWKAWCRDQGRDHPGTKQTFGRELRTVIPALDDGRPRSGDDRWRVYRGLGLKNKGGPRWSATQPIADRIDDPETTSGGNGQYHSGVAGVAMPRTADHRGPEPDEADEIEVIEL